MTESEYEARLSQLVHECEGLRGRVGQLEAEVGRYQKQEQLLSRTLLAAMSFAMKIRGEARREAELTLRNAHSEALRRSSAVEQQRDQLEREMTRLRQIADQTQTSMSRLLASTLGQLQLQAIGDLPSPEAAADLEGALSAALQRSVHDESSPRPGVDVAPPPAAP